MFTIKSINKKQLVSMLMIVLVSIFVLSSCDKAKEALDDTTKAVGDVADKAGEVAGDAADKAGEIAGDAANKVGDAAKNVTDKAGEVAGDAVNKVTGVFANNGLVGTWSGKFDSRKTVLVVTNQDAKGFSGKISIAYRKAINQEVKGKYNSDTKEVSMVDQLHSRFQGKYNGKISDDGKTYSGIFTMKLDGKKFKFNLTKK
ncbi:MAG: hypothetical protein V3V16_05220 [Melioribacteraceae bacterium]